jgi:hypothetical protein
MALMNLVSATSTNGRAGGDAANLYSISGEWL